MSVRKRKWTTKGGEEREAWIVQYIDQDGVDRIKTFARKKDADAFENQTGVDISKGTHVADSKSVTVNEAGRLWLESVTGAGLERTTIEQYRQHLNHMAPYIGHSKLSQLNAPIIRTFEDRLRANGRSPVMVNYVVRSLGALLADAQERGLVVRNAVRELSRHRGKGKDRQNERHNGKLRSASTFRPTTRSSGFWRRQKDAGGRSCIPRYSPACAAQNCAVLDGSMSISPRPSCTSVSAPIAMPRSDPRRARRESARFLCRRIW
jgi:hypothetical protein